MAARSPPSCGRATGQFLMVVPAFFGGSPRSSVSLDPAFEQPVLLRWIGDAVYIDVNRGQRGGRSLIRATIGSGTIEDVSGAWPQPIRYHTIDVSPAHNTVVMDRSCRRQAGSLDGQPRRLQSSTADRGRIRRALSDVDCARHHRVRIQPRRADGSVADVDVEQARHAADLQPDDRGAERKLRRRDDRVHTAGNDGQSVDGQPDVARHAPAHRRRVERLLAVVEPLRRHASRFSARVRRPPRAISSSTRASSSPTRRATALSSRR